MEKSNPYSFYVVLADGIMEIPQESNLSWITLFYALPKELVEKRPAYLELPRNIHQLLHSEEQRKLIESEAFLELVWDCYAWSAWQFFQVPGKGGVKHDIPGNWSNYSGDFPLWRLSYEIIKYFREKFETEMEWSFQRLFMMDKDSELPWLSYQHFGNLVGNLTDMIVEEQNWQPMIDEIWNNRQVADYSGKNISKRDFMRSWDHSRTAVTSFRGCFFDAGKEIYEQRTIGNHARCDGCQAACGSIAHFQSRGIQPAEQPGFSDFADWWTEAGNEARPAGLAEKPHQQKRVRLWPKGRRKIRHPLRRGRRFRGKC